MDGFVGLVITGIATVSIVYLLLNHASATFNVARGATKSYQNIAYTFQGTSRDNL